MIQNTSRNLHFVPKDLTQLSFAISVTDPDPMIRDDIVIIIIIN
jgi:hypothetical protein